LIHLKEGDPCEVRTAKGLKWTRADVLLASKNGKSIALVLDDSPITPSGFFVHTAIGKVTMLLTWDDVREAWEDMATGVFVELRVL
jgi:hypothetical protein